MANAPEDDLWADFEQRHRIGRSAPMRRLHERVLGRALGGTGYTTVSQADELALHLRLGPGSRVLDLGAGAGWPALHMAETTGCEVVLLDVPLEGLVSARQAADGLGLGGRTGVVRGTAVAPPFAAGTFDAIGHSDVLC